MDKNQVRYHAFLSYSHADDKWSNWVHKNLESFRFPRSICSKYNLTTNSLHPIFRDRDELPGSADLSDQLFSNLKNSDALLVLCSPKSANSIWVNAEIENYQRLSPGKKIIAFLIDGQIDDSAQESSYCLAPELVKLKEQNSDIFHIVDGRTSGRTSQSIIALIHALKNVDREELESAVKKRKGIRIFALAIMATIISFVTSIIYTNIQEQRQAELLAQSETLAVEALQQAEQGNDFSAIKTLLQALPKNLEDPERPVSESARAALQKILSNPTFKVERLNLDAKILFSLDTKESQIKLILDETNKLYMVDVLEGKIRWHIDVGPILQIGINSLNHVVIRQQDKLASFELSQGNPVCEIPLDSFPSIHQVGSTPWIVDDHILEWHYLNPQADFKTITMMDVIDTKTCQKKLELPVPWSQQVYLLEVFSESRVLFTFQSYDSETNAMFAPVIDWDNAAAEDEKLQWRSHIMGTLKSLFAGYLNGSSMEYEGPVLLPVPNKSMLMIANQAEDMSFQLMAFDTKEKTVLFKLPLEKMPSSISLDPNDENILRLGYHRQMGALLGYTLINIEKQAIEKTLTLSENTGLYVTLNALSPDDKYWISNKPGKGLMVIDEQNEIQYLINNTSRSILTASGWLDQDTGYVIDNDGSISTIHLTHSFSPTRILEDAWIKEYLTVNNEKHFIITSNNYLNWFNPNTNEVEPLLEYEWTNEKHLLGIYQDRYALISTESMGTRKLESIDLENKELSWSVSQASSAHKFVPLDNQIIIETGFQEYQINRYGQSQPERLLSQKPYITIDQSNGQPIYLEPQFLDKGMHIGVFDENGEPTLSKTLDIKLDPLAKYFQDEHTNVVYIQGSVSSVEKQKYPIFELNLDSLQIRNVGNFESSTFSSLSPPSLKTIGDYLHFSREEFFANQGIDLIINKSTGEAFEFDYKNGSTLHYADSLLMNDQVLFSQDNKLYLNRLSQDEVVPIGCSVQNMMNPPQHYHYAAHNDWLIVIDSFSGGSELCVQDTKNNKTIIKFRLPSTTGSSDFDYGPMVIYVENNQGAESAWLMTKQGLRYTIPTDKDWKELVRLALMLRLPQ
ncbi:toll/interleukin-1 receptor domain-containing protein [Alteromonas sp. ASW11-36]|uniref:Toll/interleukin-1 receptor domain-containing protein n=1 Tax=Alteromonas arenosi TaxID=3055817 RepID=A0ABT7SXI4_9ALTE|nr:toll/interleukin-1 receptor domain-containing protein [Alteromonas sp. ASW11-36]MDM7860906.1 toll/interleukin-1 receptor domain-containing protein [Alteromonas sp. ASW11-36]